MKLSITAYYDYDFTVEAHHTDVPTHYSVGTIVADKAEAERFVALFPKSAGLQASTISGSKEGTGYVRGRAVLVANGVNKGKNETGIKRYRALVRACEKLGVTIEWGTHNPARNSYATREAFEAAL